ncbi:sulfonate transport system permease protein [Actinoplanes campanulatus]|uniref:Sulfonate transport system permease protein n=1 Tax=Actinoplanes campanulatus TaxID=113559 RepID=A0A7W5FF58_9ACTN|nr:ABC transporter permease [Actinoplanes campanulatus]MBB3096146.1 sulfonate transport system permease protein [Actinoplanes campanulatus]GGN14110.1 ABC transporter permease [Actinoplanes campanulatus]GID36760.1 ABC transporter permease [Actinoplanes campanulatus]
MTTVADPPALRSRTPLRRRTRGPRRWYRLISPLALLVLWETAARTGVLPEEKVPAPSLVAQTGWRLATEGQLSEHLLDSLTRAAVGLLIGGTLAVALAATAALLRIGDNAIDPPVQMARMLPHLGLVPLLIIWVGIGEELKISLVALGSFFPLYFNTYAGIRDIDQRLVEAAKTCGLNQWERLRHVVLPGALPSLFLGLRLAIGAGWLSLVVGEQVNAQTGIGFLMMEAREFAQTDVVVFGLLVYAALGLLSDTLIRIAERRTLAWRRGLQAT